ncbi:hypothetical protein N7451_012566 [Penicillium sp. IBT 35674x]|nr:hypothetical protein N7451_012566 [Penicillium sp. IBT 35674x]
MAPRTRKVQQGQQGQQGQQEQQGEQGSKEGQGLPKQPQEAQSTTAPPEPHLSPTPPPPPPKPSKYSEVEQLIRNQIDRLKGRPNYEYHVNHYAHKIETSLICDMIEEAARRAAMHLNETPEAIAEHIDPKDMLDVIHPLQMHGCDELPPIHWTDFELTETGPHTF